MSTLKTPRTIFGNEYLSKELLWQNVVGFILSCLESPFQILVGSFQLSISYEILVVTPLGLTLFLHVLNNLSK